MEELNYVRNGKCRPNYIESGGNFDSKYLHLMVLKLIVSADYFLVTYTWDSDIFNLSEG